jgi:uncharacterized protein
MNDQSADHAKRKNRLATSSSPYLRQHEANPVDWYEWGPEALARAKREDKPILLSVGYSACHWCHVMAHESFEDAETAALMNERFVNVKVDREERPDIDAIYQKVLQLMGEGGGWPLTMFLTPAQEPFYGGTYFPKHPSHGRPSFRHVLRALSDLWRTKREDITEQTRAFKHGLEAVARSIDADAHGSAPDEQDPPLDDPAAVPVAVARLLTRVDDTWGGFGHAPKFPNATALELFAMVARQGGDDANEAARALRLTLEKMAAGGIYDHLRGGFARYAVDRVWLVPHFEKMLYDNAQLLPLYAEASVAWPEVASFRRVTEETVDWLEHDMRSPDGLFYSAMDADSEGVEGKYYCWTPAEIREVLGDESLARTFCTVYGVDEGGNFEHGWSILHRDRSLDEHATRMGVALPELERRLDEARTQLLEHRYRRVPPLRDEKVLTSWNGLVVSGLCCASSVARGWGDEARADHWRALATRAGQRLLEQHVREGGVVLRSGFEGRVHTLGVLDDVAFLGRACLDLHELTLDRHWLDYASQLAAHAIDRYAREDGDGFHLTARDAEPLIERTESTYDGPIPSGVGVVTELLLRLDASGWAPAGARATALAVLRRFRGALRQPFAFASLLRAAAHATPAAAHVTLRAPSPNDPEAVALADRIRAHRLRPGTAGPISLSYEEGESVSAVVCRAQVCSAPSSDVEGVLARLG